MNQEIKSAVLEKYQIRKTKKQKKAFIEYVTGLCERENIPISVEKSSGGRNIVMGDVDSCDYVMTAHYDTCAVMLLPNLVTPKNFLLYLIYQLFLMVVIILSCAVVPAILSLFGLSQIAFFSYPVALLLMMYLLMAGPANRHTANDNTSGTLAVINTMLSMSPSQRSRVCFVLFDNEELGLLGSGSFARRHRNVMKNKPLINCDCVSDGDYLFVKGIRGRKNRNINELIFDCFSVSAEKHRMTPVTGVGGFYPSDQVRFRHGYAVAAFNKSKLFGLYLSRIHTPADKVFIDRNIDCITDAVIMYADKLETQVTSE